LPVQPEEAGSEGLLEMRYEGAARRSQKTNPNLLDRIWNFFSSVKVAVYLILITLLLSILGTLLPQVNVVPSYNPESYYAEEYGKIGELYYALGLADTFGSWWFKGLILMIAASLIICSLDRIIPLYRALKKQQPVKHETFLKRQKVLYVGQVEDAEGWLTQAEEAIRSRRYHVTREGHALLGEKNRFSRWGPYINHVGLIILLAALLTRGLPGWFMEQGISVNEGQTVNIPGTDYYLKNQKFTEVKEVGPHVSGQELQFAFETDAILYRCVADCNNPFAEPQLEEILQHKIRPNEPLRYNSYSIYQIDYAFSPQASVLTLNVLRDGEQVGELLLNMADPAPSYQLGDISVELTGYYPELTSVDGMPATKSRLPNNPAFIFEMTHADGTTEEYFVVPFQQYQTRIRGPENSEPLSFEIGGMEASFYSSYLMVKVERALPYVLAGALIFLFGVVLGLYWQHRRIWVRIDGTRLIVAAHTNKNWFGLRDELAKILHKTGIESDAKSLDNSGVGKS
jgi:cytochrome c biogenesis protein